MAHAKNILLF